MAYSEALAQRIRSVLPSPLDFTEKKMFGGIAFMLNGNMCCGVVKESLMARVGSEKYDETLALPHARPMDFTGKPMKNMVFVDPPGIADDKALRDWIERCVAFVNTLPKK